MSGMRFPIFRLYYWSCNIQYMSFWNDTLEPDWEQMENQAFFPNTLKSLIYYTSDLSKFKCQNAVVSHSLKILSQIRRHFQWNHCSVLTPLTANQPHTLFSVKTFQQWNLKGLQTIMDLYNNKLFHTFEQLKNKFKIDSKDFLKYLQICNFIKKKCQEYPMNNVLLNNQLQKGSVSKIYSCLSQII